jgi:hypothetical protein
VLIVYESVDMKDNVAVITKVLMWFCEQFHWNKTFQSSFMHWCMHNRIQCCSLLEHFHQRKTNSGNFSDWTSFKCEN